MPNLPTPDQIRLALEAHPKREIGPLPGRTNHKHGAVLLPLLYRPELYCIATVRAADMRQHAGEICFPGGMPEPGDADLSATALREANEEIGLHSATVLGDLSSIPLYTSNHRVFPFIAHAPDQPFTPNPREVAAVLELPVLELLALPHVDGLHWHHKQMTGTAPVFELDGGLMYGATAQALYELLTIIATLLDRQPPPLQTGRYSWADVLPKDFVPPQP